MRSRPSTPLQWLMLLLAVGFGAAAVFHALAIAVPSIAEPSPAWRHGLFVLVNSAVAAGLARRPAWFAPLFAALTVQQLYSHGISGWHAWVREQRLDWASLLVVIALPPIAVMLLGEAWAGRRGRPAERPSV